MSEATHWTIDKRIPLALIGTIIAQIFFVGWFMSDHERRIASLEEKTGDVAILMSRITENINEVKTNAGETKVHLQYLSSSVKEIENILKERNPK